MKSLCALLAALLVSTAANASVGVAAPHADAMTDGTYMQLARVGGGGGGIRAGGGAHASGNFSGNIRGGSSPTINHTTNVNIGSNNYHGGGNNIHGETYNGGSGTIIHGETYHGGSTTIIHGETYHYYDGWDDHPIAAGVAFGTAAAVTAAAIGSVVYSVPSSCGTVIVNGLSYYQCGTVWYRPQYYGTTVQYVVVTAPR